MSKNLQNTANNNILFESVVFMLNPHF